MIRPLIVLGVCADDGAMAEKLVDFIYQQHDRKPVGHALIVCADSLHPEMVIKIRISAELAFESVTVLDKVVPNRTETKPERINGLFSAAADYVLRHYRTPWLWLEPDCVPLKPDWIDRLALSYDNQPRRYMGSRLKVTGVDGERMFLSRVAIYPQNAADDLRAYCQVPADFSIVAGEAILPRSTKSVLFQQLAYNGEKQLIKPDAVLLHHDKRGMLLSEMLRAMEKPETNGLHPTVEEMVAPERTIEPVKKLDGRSKEARAMKLAGKN